MARETIQVTILFDPNNGNIQIPQTNCTPMEIAAILKAAIDLLMQQTLVIAKDQISILLPNRKM